ncbi:MAG: hypothetical protein NHB15_18045 [Methanosarcina barkeri]|nr:hypothetical protein [Methanosarcina sp. ERenArc_MAG2]
MTNYGSNNTSVIDTATNTVIDTVNVGTNPFGVAVTPDGSKVYVANNGDGTVSIINTTTNTVTDTINVGGMPFAFGQFIGPDPAQQILPVGEGSSGGSGHSSANGGEGKAIVVRGSNASNSTDNTNSAGTIMQSENNTQSVGQNDGTAEANVERTSGQKKAATTPAKESKKAHGFEIIYGFVSLLVSRKFNSLLTL